MAARYGHWVFDAAGVEILGPDDFTLLSLGKYQIPEYIGDGSDAEVYTPTFTLDVPGYDSSSCYLIITPNTYNPNEQLGYSHPDDRFVPTYKDLGGTVIGIYCCQNYGMYTGVSDKYKPSWRARSAACVVEVVRFK